MHNCIYGFFTLCEMIVWIYFFISFRFHFFGEWNLFLKQMILQFGFSLHFFWSLDFYSPHFILNRMDLSFWNECRSILIATMIGETIIIMIILLFLLVLSQFIDTFNFETFQRRLRRRRQSSSSFIWISIVLFRQIRQVSNTTRFHPKENTHFSN